MFCVLVQVLSFDRVTAPGGILCHQSVAFIVVAGVLGCMALLAGRANAWRTLMDRAMALRR